MIWAPPLVTQESEGEQEEERAPAAASGTLRGRPANLKHGDRMLVVYVEKWGFKEGAGSFKEPQVALSVRDQDGESVEAVQVGTPGLPRLVWEDVIRQGVGVQRGMWVKPSG